MKAEARIKVAENFFLDEFVDPHTYYSNPDRGRNVMDERLFKIAQAVRDTYGKPLAINNWWPFMAAYRKPGKTFNSLEFLYWCEAKRISVWSGYRSPLSHVGAKTGAHYKGLAIDLKAPGRDLFKIVKNEAEYYYYLGVRRLEDPRITPTWLHIDTWERNTEPNSIRVVDLKRATEIIRF